MDAAPTTMSIAQRIAALNIQTESSSASSQPPPAATIKPKSNALASRIAAMEQRNVVSSSTSDDVNNNDDKSGGDGGQDGGIIKQYKTEKPKVGKLKPLPAGTTIPVIGFGPPPPSLKQREREERMELMKREAKESTEGEETMDGDHAVLPTAAESRYNTQDDTTEQHIVGKIKLPVGAVPMMLPITPGLPPIMLKKQREREERMEEMQREAKLAEETEADDATTSPATDENIDDDALLSRPTVTGVKRRPKTRN